MSFDYSKLRVRIYELYGSARQFARHAGLSYNQTCRILKNESGISQSNIILWCALLKIDRDEIGTYFFVPLVNKC